MTTLDDSDLARFAEAILAESGRKGLGLAEVFLKASRSLRCEIGPLGVRSIEDREETGAAVRVWTHEGRAGFAHTDAPRIERVEALVRAARSAAQRHPEDPPPNLPVEDRTSPERGAPSIDSSAQQRGRSSENRRHPPSERHRVEDPVVPAPPGKRSGQEPCPIEANESFDVASLQTLAHRLIGAFSAPGREGIGLLQGWVEFGTTRTVIANGAGGRARSELGLVSAGVLVRALGGGRDAGLPPLIRYAQTAGSFEELDPDRIAAEAAWRAGASTGGESHSAREAIVLLEPRTAASWLRAVVSAMQEGSRPEDHDRQGGGIVAWPEIPGLDLIDDPALPFGPPVPDHDGVGRGVRRRVLLLDGRPFARAAGSPGSDDAGDEPEPMRRDSYRDPPVAGPIKPYLRPGDRTREELLQGLEEGLFVTSSTPYAAQGSASFVAEVRGIWIESGRARKPVAGTLLVLPTLRSLARIEARGSDLEFDDGGPPTGAPTLRISGALLIAPREP